MLKFPYGISDFKKIITEGYLYCDRTDKIPLLERGTSQLFIRPRRFGKSLLLSMLENYYDVAKKDEFDTLFGGCAIGKHPTQARNSYFILRLDFSCVDPTGGPDDIRQSLFNHINARITRLTRYYENAGYDFSGVEINPKDAIASLESLLSTVVASGHPVYLLIDEYDNFANTVMMGMRSEQERYAALVHDEGALRTLFKTIKSATSGAMFDRVFITGVSPVVMSDITSGYNIAKDIYFNRALNDLCGFREKEVRRVVEEIISTCGQEGMKVAEAMDLIRSYYNGYRFCRGDAENIYNPTLCLYFFDYFLEECRYPRKMLDANLAVDESKLTYIAQLPAGRDILISMLEKDHELVVGSIEDRFGLSEMLGDESQDRTFLVSFLYYFGVLTLSGESPEGKLILKVPNLVMQSLYVERVQRMLLPDPIVRDAGKAAGELVYQKGDMQPLCTFVEGTYFQVFKNRDYRWANELTLKTAFLTLLYNDILFIMDSEMEVDRKYADLTMIIRPDKRRFTIFDVLIEFKFVSLADTGLSGDQAREMSLDDVYALPGIRKALDQGHKQVQEYGRRLENKYGNLRLKKFVVAALGFERVCFRQV